MLSSFITRYEVGMIQMMPKKTFYNAFIRYKADTIETH